jgi:hypothetical protein
MKPYKDLIDEEKIACISLYPIEAKHDKKWHIRIKAYRMLGFTKEAKKDEDWRIRREAYQILGFTKEALQDADSDIRNEAKLYFNVLNYKNTSIKIKINHVIVKKTTVYHPQTYTLLPVHLFTENPEEDIKILKELYENDVIVKIDNNYITAKNIYLTVGGVSQSLDVNKGFQLGYCIPVLEDYIFMGNKYKCITLWYDNVDIPDCLIYFNDSSV